MNKKLLIALAAVVGVGGIVTAAIVSANSKKNSNVTPTPSPLPIVTEAPKATDTPAPKATDTPVPTTAPVVGQTKDIVILYTNDVHTYVEIGDGKSSYNTVAQLKKDLIAAGKDVILVDAGDHLQGTAYGAMDKGVGIQDIMAAAGYDLATLGNHEFDYGMDRVLELVKGSVPYVSSNFRKADGSLLLDAYKMFDLGGKKVAVIGVTTPESITKSTPKYFMDEKGNWAYTIDGGTDGKALYETVQKTIDAAKAAGADYIIGLGHLGVDAASKPYTSEELIANVKGFDAFIDGHSHTVMESKNVKDAAGKNVVLTQTGQYFTNIGQLTIDKTGKVTTQLIANSSASDATVKAKIDSLVTKVDGQLGLTIGYAPIGLYIADPATSTRLIRKQETNLGDFCADAIYYLFDTTEGLDIDVAVMNGGGIRADLTTGAITYKTAKTIHPFGNVMCLMEVTGQQILDMLEWSYKSVETSESGGFLQVAGLKCTVDTAVPANVIKDADGMWAGSNKNAEYRVKNVKILDKKTGKYVALDLKKTYRLGGTNYTLRNSGDGFAMFGDATLVKDYVMEDYLCLANYVMSFDETQTPAGKLPTISKTAYSKLGGDGRITIKSNVGSETGDNNIIGVLFALVLMTGAAAVVTKRRRA